MWESNRGAMAALLLAVTGLACGRLGFEKVNEFQGSRRMTDGAVGDRQQSFDRFDGMASRDSGQDDSATPQDGNASSSDAGATDGDAGSATDGGTADAGAPGPPPEDGTCAGPYDMSGGRSVFVDTCLEPDSLPVCGSPGKPDAVFVLTVEADGCEVQLDPMGATVDNFDILLSTVTNVCEAGETSCITNFDRVTFGPSLAGRRVSFAVETADSDCGELTVSVTCP